MRNIQVSPEASVQNIRPPCWQDVPVSQWRDWRWQLRNRICSVDQLSQVIVLSREEQEAIRRCLGRLRMAITPYYASLLSPLDAQDPIRRQAVPSIQELVTASSAMSDPLHEDEDSPVPGLTHRYPDRVLLLVTDQCAMYCRHCTRRRMAGQQDGALPNEHVLRAIEYIRNTPQIRDVLLSGGDPLTLGTGRLEGILRAIRQIPHVEIIRIGTRIPVVLPYRVTSSLCRMLRRYHPLFINTHFNHPRELTIAAREACSRLADAGISLGNQSVLLKGVNDCPYLMRELTQDLLTCRVRPYYLYQCDLAEGVEHFRTPIAKGIEIIEYLRGHTSGLAVPTFVVDAPGGGGKIPLAPQYFISQSDTHIILRNYEGVICSYARPEDKSAHAGCEYCRDAPAEPTGLEKLYSGQLLSLVPQANNRLRRRTTFHGNGGET